MWGVETWRNHPHLVTIATEKLPRQRYLYHCNNRWRITKDEQEGIVSYQE